MAVRQFLGASQRAIRASMMANRYLSIYSTLHANPAKRQVGA
jgi:hypothetical protein